VGDRALVSEGRVWTVRSGEVVEGSVQVALLRGTSTAGSRRCRSRSRGVSGGAFRDEQVGFVTLRTRDLPEQRLYLWFPPSATS
jgi:hypothetical protein